MTKPLWTPSPERVEHSNLRRFMKAVTDQWGVDIPDYSSLYRWSIQQPEAFWKTVWGFGNVIAETQGETTLDDAEEMPGARWFPEAWLNFAENLLWRRDEAVAIVFWGEDKIKRTLTFEDVYNEVSCLAQALRDAGVVKGDRVAGYLPNMPETVIAMLATTSIGAIWSSCSPDFGVRGVVDRFGQIEPKVLFGADGYFYNGQSHDLLEKTREIVNAIPSIEQLVIVPYTRDNPPLDSLSGAMLLQDYTRPFAPAAIQFERLPFDHPLYIMYSSGTTGVPKCIVHGAGGTLLQHLKELQLHTDVKPGDRVFYFTTCGWMMWNWLVSALGSGATILLYDGSPFYPDGHSFFNFADAASMSIFGTSAKYIDAVRKAEIIPANDHHLGSVRTMLSTGSPLSPESFDFVYKSIKPDICLSSISGGTDIVSCFVLGNPMLPVWRGEIQCRGLGMKVEVFDEEGRSVQGEKGELVCTAPFPSMPIGFWNDPDDHKYQAAYFNKFPNVWCHGDYVELTEHDGIIIYGRSDAVLNPGGVRIGTAEIYRQVEQLDEVMESLVIAQDWQDDCRVVLFVRLREGLELDESLSDRIRVQIRKNASPRHVPAKILQISDIPRTKNGKIVELAVRNVVHGRPVKNKEALANPEVLELYRDLPELQS